MGTVDDPAWTELDDDLLKEENRDKLLKIWIEAPESRISEVHNFSSEVLIRNAAEADSCSGCCNYHASTTSSTGFFLAICRRIVSTLFFNLGSSAS